MKQQTADKGKRPAKAKSSSQRSQSAADKDAKLVTAAEVPSQAPADTVKPAPGTWQHFERVVEFANGGDPAALSLLRRYLNLNPHLWQQAGDLATRAEMLWLDHVGGGNQLVIESVKRRLAELKSTLKGAHATPLESLVADNIAVTWLATYAAEMAAASSEARSLALAAYVLRQAESAQKRHLLAMKTLTMLRTLTARGLAPVDSVKLFAPHQESA